MEYTKGEWTHFGDGMIVAPDGRQIASVFPRDRVGNAYLITAAPDLLVSLRNLHEQLIARRSAWYLTSMSRELTEMALTKAGSEADNG